MPNYAALKTEAASLAAAGDTDAQTIATLNAATIAVPVSVSTSALAEYLGLAGALAGVLAFAASPPSGASAASIAAAEMLAFAVEHPSTVPGFDMTNPAVASAMQSDLAALVSPGSGISGPISAAQQTAILGMASTAISWSAQNGWPDGINENDLTAARAIS